MDSRAVELVAKEAQRSQRTFEEVANMDTDDAAWSLWRSCETDEGCEVNIGISETSDLWNPLELTY